MKDKEYILYDLLTYINKSEKETNDTIVAKALVENRYDLDNLSMDELSSRYFVSQPTISRFIKKMGYPNYNAFRNAMNLSIYTNKLRNPPLHNTDPEAIRKEVKAEIQEALDCIDSIDIIKLKHIVEIMKDYNTIVFMGSELSMAIAYKLQLGLISLGKNVYNLYSVNYQEQMLHIIEKHDDVLMICISIEGRWISRFEDLKNIKELPYKILWTIEDDPVDANLFDLVYHFGHSVKEDLGYNELMYFILLVNRMIKND